MSDQLTRRSVIVVTGYRTKKSEGPQTQREVWSFIDGVDVFNTQLRCVFFGSLQKVGPRNDVTRYG